MAHGMATVDKYKSKIGRLIVRADTLRYFAPPPGGGEHAGAGPGGGDRRGAAATAMDAVRAAVAVAMGRQLCITWGDASPPETP